LTPFCSLAVAVHALLAPTAHATPSPNALPNDPSATKLVAVEDPPIFPLKDIQAGMKGNGYTVFSTRDGPEPFAFEVLGVLRSYLGPGEDLIVARLTGEKIERTGVIAGMSGSPAYIDGKLVGAVGYRFGAFTDEPIAGITPIERMLTVAAPVAGARPSPATRTSTGSMTSWGSAAPIATPIAAAGIAPAILEAFQPEFQKRGYAPVFAASGTAGNAGGKNPTRLYAGGPIAGTLVDGDIAMAGIGTVTWVKGNRFLAFGHPFLGTGASNMPISNAEIITTVSSKAGSWKMGQATAPLGRLSDDRLHAIAGDMGEAPSTMPLRVKIVTDGPRAQDDALMQQTFHVIRHPTDTPLFTAVAVAQALTARVGGERGGTVDARAKITLSTGEVVPLEFRASDDGGSLEMPIAFGLLARLGQVVEQDFAKVELSRVDLEVTGRTVVRRARVLSVDATRALVPGKEGEVRVRMQPWQGKPYEMRLPVRVPRNLPGGTWQLVAAGAGESSRVERDGGLVPQPTSFAQHVTALRDEPPPGSLSVYLVDDEGGLRVDGSAMPDLPPSLAGLLSEGGGLSGAPVEARAVRLVRSVDDGVVVGEARAKIILVPPSVAVPSEEKPK
jgi:hypothetical protein